MNFYRYFLGMCWPVPGDDMDELEWRLRYAGELPMSDRLVAASVLDAYKELIRLPQLQRNARIRELRKGPGIAREEIEKGVKG